MTMSARQFESLPGADHLGDTEHLRVFMVRASERLIVVALAKDGSLTTDMLACIVEPAFLDVSPGWLHHVVPLQHERSLELIEFLDEMLGPLAKEMK